MARQTRNSMRFALAIIGMFGVQMLASAQAPSPTSVVIAPRPSKLTPGLEGVVLSDLAQYLPLLPQLNVTTLNNWLPVLEAINPEVVERWGPWINAIDAPQLERLINGLVAVNASNVLNIMDEVNNVPPRILEAYIRIISKLSPTVIRGLVPTINGLDITWVEAIVPNIRVMDERSLILLVEAVAPVLGVIKPELLVAVLPALNSVDVKTWVKLIEMANKLTVAELEFFLHLLDVTGPYIDRIIFLLDFIRQQSTIGLTIHTGYASIYTKPKFSDGPQNGSVPITSFKLPDPKYVKGNTYVYNSTAVPLRTTTNILSSVEPKRGNDYRGRRLAGQQQPLRGQVA